MAGIAMSNTTNTKRILALNEPVNTFIPVLMVTLAEMGLGVIRSFDLQSACAPHGSPCPHHGINPCSCQMIVLMIYDWEGNQYGVIAHGSEGMSELSVCLDGQDPDLLIVESIILAAETAEKAMQP